MKIAISGSHGVGKTTLAQAIARHLGVPGAIAGTETTEERDEINAF